MAATSLSLLDPPQAASPTDEVLESRPVESIVDDHPATVAARTLFETYERPVFRYCCTRLRSRDEAEDAT